MPINDIFIVMPFNRQRSLTEAGARDYSKSHFDQLYKIIREVISAYRRGIRVERADETKFGNIVQNVVKRVYEADLVIAVLTAKNPNVFWELGIRHALRKGTMMLLAHRDEVPFDLHGYFSHEYSIDGYDDISALKEFLTERLKEYDREELEDSPVLDILQRAEYDQFRAWNVIETRRAALVLIGLFKQEDSIDDLLRAILDESQEFLEDVTKVPRRVRVSVDSFDGFARTRPLVGLNDDSYTDAHNFLGRVLQFEDAWNQIIEAVRAGSIAVKTKRDRKKLVMSMQKSIAPLMFRLHLLMVDTISALEHVVLEKDAWTIPWANSLDRMDVQGSFMVEELQELAGRVSVMVPEMFLNLQKFEQDMAILMPVVRAPHSAPKTRKSTTRASKVPTKVPGKRARKTSRHTPHDPTP